MRNVKVRPEEKFLQRAFRQFSCRLDMGSPEVFISGHVKRAPLDTAETGNIYWQSHFLT
ncbi:hypothetical protein MJ1HA_0535 [Metallosphaera sedula]|nr:hypothetical protein MJ1HA_0535 [Metallosphaera sedula]